MKKKTAILLLPYYDYKAFDKEDTLSKEEALQAMEDYGKEVIDRANTDKGDEFTCIFAWDFEATNGVRWISDERNFHQHSFDMISQDVWEKYYY